MAVDQQARERALALARARRRRAEAGIQTAEAQPQADYSFLEERGLADDQQARDLFDAWRTAPDEQEARMAQIRFAGYLDGRDATDDAAGAESRGEANLSRAETGLRGFGQGVFGLGDFSAALGSWVGEGGPMGNFSLREHFAYQRQRREGMSERNPVTATTGYIAGAVTGGGGVASGTTRLAARAPGAVGRTARNVFARQQGQRGLADLGRAAAGSAVASGTAAALEGGDAGDIATATALGGVAGPAGEKVLEGGAYAVRGALRRLNPERAAEAAISRRMGEGGQMMASAAARDLNREVGEQGGTILEAAGPRQAAQLGEEASLSEEGFDLLTERLPEMQNVRAARMQRAVQGEDLPVSADDVRAREATAFQAARRTEARMTAEDVRGIRREGQEAARAQRLQNQRELAEGEEAIAAATGRLQANLARAADNQSALVTPEALEATRKAFADDTMGAIGEEIVTVPNAGNILGRDAVRRILGDYASAADPAEAAPIRELLNIAADEAEDVSLTLRQIDAFRRATDAAGEANPALRRGLTEVADELGAAAARDVPEYGQFLDQYARLSRTLEGARRGMQVRGAQISRLADEIRLAQQAEGIDRPAFVIGVERGAQRAVADEVRRSPAAARRVAEQMRDEPQRFEIGMGRRGEGAGRVAQAGIDEIEEAEAALAQLRRNQRADEEALRDVTSDEAFARSQAGQERIQALRDQMEARLAPIARAQQVLNAGTEDFQRAAGVAGEAGMDEAFRRVARTALAEAAGEGAEGATTVAQRLANDPGLQRRVSAVLGEEAFDALQGVARREEAASEAVMSAARGASSNLRQMSRKEREAIVSAVDLGVMATDRWSGSFGANAFLRLLRQVSGDEQRAFALARALTEGDRATQRRTMARLAQLGASIETQRMYAQAAGAGAGIVTGQEVVQDDQ